MKQGEVYRSHFSDGITCFYILTVEDYGRFRPVNIHSSAGGFGGAGPHTNASYEVCEKYKTWEDNSDKLFYEGDVLVANSLKEFYALNLDKEGENERQSRNDNLQSRNASG